MLKYPTNSIVVATNNRHKAEEFGQILGDKWKIYTAKDLGDIEWDENGTTFFENSEIKALAVTKHLPQDLKTALIIADDSGLCVDILNGEPGIFSSRYAGENGNDAANNELLLKNLKDISKVSNICKKALYWSIMQEANCYRCMDDELSISC